MNFRIDSFKAKIPINSVFRCLRISAGMTTKELARLMECSSTLITHYEMGNRVLTDKRLAQMCRVFRVTRDDLEEYTTGRRAVPINYRDECILLLSKMDTARLQTIHSVLIGMTR
mgnify:CR=1 FL=1